MQNAVSPYKLCHENLSWSGVKCCINQMNLTLNEDGMCLS